ncbi:hypothetical protein EMPS_09163 [Entomortierella parvispora]|uniref:Glutathione S-transferase n=1 Tax=Entomortierella parvispora TaxID=205924 RepID=A0A9P3HHG3_9FUNG|nr:hypothetical protein EMPS_09163 [Entomortierella parvispora]
MAAATTSSIDQLLPKATKAPSDVLAKAAETSTDSSFKLLYFGLHGRGEMSRTLLAYGGVRYEEIPLQWPVMKADTRFGCLPVLYETTSSGTVLQLSESLAIERYLARKFNLLGSNAWEEHLVNEYTNSTETLSGNFMKICFVSDEVRQKEAEIFYRDHLTRWVQVHERLLAEEGQKQNGHYVGDKITLADIRTTVMMDRVLFLVPKGQEETVNKILNKETAPGLWKVRETVHAHPLIAAWKKSQRHQEIDAGTKGFFKF